MAQYSATAHFLKELFVMARKISMQSKIRSTMHKVPFLPKLEGNLKVSSRSEKFKDEEKYRYHKIRNAKGGSGFVD
jgi:hypothetical protein